MASLDPRENYSVRRQLLDSDLSELRGLMSGRVLEIGAGHGPRRGEFRPPVSAAESWIYLDLEQTRRPDLQANIETLPLASGSFDTVLCLEVLEYVSSPAKGLAELRRVLKPGGRLIMTTPFLHRMDTEHDLFRYTEQGLRNLLGEAGFEILELRSQANAMGVAVNIFKQYLNCQPEGRRRRWMSRLSYPLLSLLWRLDKPTARRHPLLRTFSTGYLAVARARIST